MLRWIQVQIRMDHVRMAFSQHINQACCQTNTTRKLQWFVHTQRLSKNNRSMKSYDIEADGKRKHCREYRELMYRNIAREMTQKNPLKEDFSRHPHRGKRLSILAKFESSVMVVLLNQVFCNNFKNSLLRTQK